MGLRSWQSWAHSLSHSPAGIFHTFFLFRPPHLLPRPPPQPAALLPFALTKGGPRKSASPRSHLHMSPHTASASLSFYFPPAPVDEVSAQPLALSRTRQQLPSLLPHSFTSSAGSFPPAYKHTVPPSQLPVAVSCLHSLPTIPLPS